MRGLPCGPMRDSRSCAARLMPRRLTVRLRTLTPSIEVRILTGHPVFHRKYNSMRYFGDAFRQFWRVLRNSADSRRILPYLGDSMQHECSMLHVVNVSAAIFSHFIEPFKARASQSRSPARLPRSLASADSSSLGIRGYPSEWSSGPSLALVPPSLLSVRGHHVSHIDRREGPRCALTAELRPHRLH